MDKCEINLKELICYLDKIKLEEILIKVKDKFKLRNLHDYYCIINFFLI